MNEKIYQTLLKLWKKYDMDAFMNKAIEVATLNDIQEFLETI